MIYYKIGFGSVNTGICTHELTSTALPPNVRGEEFSFPFLVP